MRRSLVVLMVLLLAVVSLPALAGVELYRVGVENPCGLPIPYAPANITYTLNCQADVTIQIVPSDSAGQVAPDAWPIWTWTLLGELKGKHTYSWRCMDDAGYQAPEGHYVARVTAQACPARWDANIGLFKNWEKPAPTHEWPYRDSADAVSLPRDTAQNTDETIMGFYGIGVNDDPNSPYFGRVYVAHTVNKDIYMYDVDGAYLGTMNDSGVAWFSSAPWDLSVADDGYVYVCDRSSMYIYCFSPDGQLVSRSPLITNFRTIFARTAADGTTYVFSSSSNIIYQSTVSADHLTWGEKVNTGTLMSSGYLMGMWVSPDLLTMYCAGGPSSSWMGVRKYARTSVTGTWTHDPSWTCTLGNVGCADVEMGPDDSYMWVTVFRAYTPTTPSLCKISVADGSILAGYDIVTYGLMLASDGIGNVACTFGKSTITWPGKYWGIFSEPGCSTSSTRTTGPFYSPEDPGPIVVPGSEHWSYNDPSGQLTPDGTDTATVTFKVMDPNGYSDIGQILLDLKELKTTADPFKVVPPDSVVPDPYDLTAVTVTKTVTAVSGVRPGERPIVVSVADVHGSPEPAGTLHVEVAGNFLSAYVRHIRTNANIPDARLRAVGGKPGVYGYPFIYESESTTDSNGYVEMPISEGIFDITAVKTGYKTQTPVSFDAAPVSVGGGSLLTPSIYAYLGPLTIAELRSFGTQSLYASAEGLVYAQPKGLAPTMANGMDYRLYNVDWSGAVMYKSWYMCDANDAGSGMLFMLRPKDTTFTRQWDDSSSRDIYTYNSLYLGKRPAVGETICVFGWLSTLPGYETRFVLDDATLGLLQASRYKEVFMNLSDYGIVPVQPLPAPVNMTINQVNHDPMIYYHPAWGKYAQVNGLTPVRWVPDGRYVPDNGQYPTDISKFIVVADSLGRWGTITFNSIVSTGIGTDENVCPVTLGNTYTFIGACGRRCRYGEGTLRPRGPADLVLTGIHELPDPDSVDQIRGLGSGFLEVRGIVTAKFADSYYVEDSDRSVGVKVAQSAWWVNVGDEVVVRGNVEIVNGVKQITAPGPAIVLSSGNPLPILNMGARDVGGADYGPNDPGVTNGRGALNIGLLVKIQGMVTARDSSANPSWFYIWDGSNMVDEYGTAVPLDDGTGNKGVRVESNFACAPWTDWVEVTGIAGADMTVVPGKTIAKIIPSVTPAKVTAFDTIQAPDMTPGDEIRVDAGFYPGSALFALPVQPAGLGSGSEFGPKPWDPTVVLNCAPETLDCSIYRWESTSQSQYTYDLWCEPGGQFGGLLLGDGYWMQLQNPWAFTYSGKRTTGAQWISFGMPGTAQLGHPQEHETDLGDVYIHDGAQVIPFRDASQYGLGWLNSVCFWWNSAEQSQYDAGLPDDWPTGSSSLEPWHGYMFWVEKENISFIVP